MFYLKNDDMEELFRKAAENYEVDTGKASNWEAINDALHNNSDNNPNEKDKKKKRRFIFWWFLLFPAGWMAHNTWTTIGNNDSAVYTKYAAPVQYQPVQKKQQEKSSGAEQSAIEQSAMGEEGNNSSKNRELNTQTTNGAIEIDNNTRVTGEKVLQGIPVVINPSKRNNNINKEVPAEITINTVNNTKKKLSNGVNVDRKEKSTLPQQSFTSKALFEKNKPTRFNASEKNIRQQQYSNPLDENSNINASLQWVGNDLMWTLPPVENNAFNLQKLPTDSKTSFAENDSAAKQKNIRLQKESIHYFYLDAVASADLTTVKLQHVSGTGSSFGLLLGYRFNKRLHVEAGAFLEKKVYYTEGKYFDTSKLSDYLRSVEILDVDGNCKMITVPVNIRYNVLTNANRNWFIATGVSSYFMNSEYYDYNVKHPGGQPYVTSKGYKVSENDWLSVVNISLGYERNFWKSYHIRVEPYFRLPLSGVGTGNLSLRSAGLYIGIGRRF